VWKFKDEREKWSLLLSSFALLASIAAAGFTGLQWKAADRSAKAAEEAAKTTKDSIELQFKTLRPRLFISGVTPASTTTNPQPLDHGKLRITFRVPNYGPLPATKVRFRTFDNVSSWNEVKRLPYGQPRWEYPQIILPVSAESPPGLGIVGERIISESEIKGLISHTLVATFSVLIEYEDDSGRPHKTEYCDEFTFQPNMWNQPCPWPVQTD
jgi:hypothetical protein